MTLVINLDSRKEIIEGIEFEIKPLNQAGLEKLGTFANQNLNTSDEKSTGLQMLSNPALDKILLEIVPAHIKMTGTFKIQEKGKLRNGKLEDIFKLDSGAFLTIKTKLISALMTGSTLTSKESKSVKK